jgi:hypothetical protein
MRSILTIGLLAALSLLAAETVPLPHSGWSEDFNNFNGTHGSIPAGMAVSKDGSSAMTADDPDFRGLSDGNITTGGCYAWNAGESNTALGYQPTSDEFTPGWFQITFSNTSSRAYRYLEISYDAVMLNNADRSSKIEVQIILTNGGSIQLPQLSCSSPSLRSTSPQWTRTPLRTQIKVPHPVEPGQTFALRWCSDDNGGSGSRDEIGIDDASVKGIHNRGTVITIR